jgi:hypothetical protein
MMRRFSRKITVMVAGAALLVAGSGVAYAFWTAGGTGGGTATAGQSTGITVNQSTVVAPMAPGVAAQTLSGTFTNTNTAPVYVATVTASITSVTKAVGAAAGPCTAGDYTLADAAMTVNAQVPVGTGGAWTGASIAFANDVAANQDGCQGATVNLTYTVS